MTNAVSACSYFLLYFKEKKHSSSFINWYTHLPSIIASYSKQCNATRGRHKYALNEGHFYPKKYALMIIDLSV